MKWVPIVLCCWLCFIFGKEGCLHNVCGQSVCSLEGPFWEGKNQDVPGVLDTKVVCGVCVCAGGGGGEYYSSVWCAGVLGHEVTTAGGGRNPGRVAAPLKSWQPAGWWLSPWVGCRSVVWGHTGMTVQRLHIFLQQNIASVSGPIPVPCYFMQYRRMRNMHGVLVVMVRWHCWVQTLHFSFVRQFCCLVL